MARFDEISTVDKQHDLEILNHALYYEHQGIWAYDFAAGKLSSTHVGNAVLALALENQADHKQHRDTLSEVIRELDGIPVPSEVSYNLSPYLNIGEGSFDSDINIAKLALALETDAAIAYSVESAKLKIPALRMAGTGIGSVESIHAARIRAAFNQLGMEMPIVPSAMVSVENRDQWVLTI